MIIVWWGGGGNEDNDDDNGNDGDEDEYNKEGEDDDDEDNGKADKMVSLAKDRLSHAYILWLLSLGTSYHIHMHYWINAAKAKSGVGRWNYSTNKSRL